MHCYVRMYLYITKQHKIHRVLLQLQNLQSVCYFPWLDDGNIPGAGYKSFKCNICIQVRTSEPVWCVHSLVRFRDSKLTQHLFDLQITHTRLLYQECSWLSSFLNGIIAMYCVYFRHQACSFQI